MKWNNLDSVEKLSGLIEESKISPIMIFKHSTRCSISSTSLSRLERKWSADDTTIKPYYLDLIAHRDISNTIASKFGVEHQSPQALIIKDGKCTYNASHFDIDYNQLLSQL